MTKQSAGPRISAAGWIAFAIACAGCSTTPPIEAPLSITLPLSQTDVADRRMAFAATFEAELLADGQPAKAADWLSLPADAPPQPAAVPPASTAAGTSVLIAPGIFGDCVAAQSVPFGDGVERPVADNFVQGYGGYASLGLQSIRAVPLWGRASSEKNAELLADAVLQEAAKPQVQAIVLVGYSKGTSDALQTLELLQRRQALPAKLKALVSVAGVVNGTVIADHNEKLYEALGDKFNPLDCTPSQGGEVASLTKRTRLAWLDRQTLPASVRRYTLVARADAETVAPGLSYTFRQLSVLGDRNDGQVLLADAILPGSMLLAVALSDHWKFVLPLDRHPSLLVRGLVNDSPYPRAALFRAVLKTVVADIAAPPPTTKGTR